MICHECGWKYHGNCHRCPQCGSDNLGQKVKQVERRANDAYSLAWQAGQRAREAEELARSAHQEAGNHRKQIGISTGIVSSVCVVSATCYQIFSDWWFAVGAAVSCLLSVALLFALVRTYLPRSGVGDG